MSVRNFLLGGAGFLALVAGVGWAVPQALKESRAGPTLVGTTQPQLTSDGKWQVQAGESCSSIAAFFKVPEQWTTLRDRNYAAIKEIAIKRSVPPETCPLDVGMRLNIPSGWVPGGIVIQTWQVDHDWGHWKRALAGGIFAGILIGVLVALWVCWRFLRKRPIHLPEGYKPPPEQ